MSNENPVTVSELELTEPVQEAPVSQGVLPLTTTGQEAAEDVAAAYFKMYGPKFTYMLSQLSKKAALRLIDNLVKYPLQDGEIRFGTEFEKNAFLIGRQLLDSKMMMTMAVLLERQAQEAEANASQVNNNENKESDNG